MSQKGDVAIDDIAMSPKCFGLGKNIIIKINLSGKRVFILYSI